MSCKKYCCARGIHGGRNGAVLDQHDGNGTEVEDESRCIGTGRNPRVDMDRDVDDRSPPNAEEVGACTQTTMTTVLTTPTSTTTTTADDDGDNKQATTTTAGLGPGP